MDAMKAILLSLLILTFGLVEDPVVDRIPWHPVVVVFLQNQLSVK